MSEHRPSSRPVDEVVDAVATTAQERERVREALDPISDGEQVTTEAVETAVSDTAKLVATAETRTELAGISYDDATEIAAGVADVPVVASRLASYHERLASVEQRAAGLGEQVPSPDEELEPPRLHQIGLDLRSVATSAQGVATTADDLSWDLEQFESFVEDPERRHEEFQEDAELVEESAAALRSQVEEIDQADDQAVAWAAATMQARVLDLLVVDLRAELDDLATMADRQAERVPAELGQRVDALDREVTMQATRLDDRAEAAWRERFAEELNALTEGLSGLEPPVEWGRVEELASEQREAIGVE